MPARTRRKIVFVLDPEPDFSWLEQDMYNPAKPGYDPIWPDRTTMRHWQRLRAKGDDDAADAYRKVHAYDPEWYRNPDNHVALTMLVYELTAQEDDWQLVDSLSNIDFLDDDSDDHGTGTFYSVEAIPKNWTSLRTLARDAKLPRYCRAQQKLRAALRESAKLRESANRAEAKK